MEALQCLLVRFFTALIDSQLIPLHFQDVGDKHRNFRTFRARVNGTTKTGLLGWSGQTRRKNCSSRSWQKTRLAASLPNQASGATNSVGLATLVTFLRRTVRTRRCLWINIVLSVPDAETYSYHHRYTHIVL